MAHSIGKDAARLPARKRGPFGRAQVESSAVRSVGYDDAARTLDVEFEGGAVYRYFDVPPAVHRRLMAASSKGRFVNYRIKGAYRYEHVA